MLDTALSHHAWLPLQPLESQVKPTSGVPLPGASCFIEALRDSIAPISYTRTSQAASARARVVDYVVQTASTRDLAALVDLHARTLPMQYDPAFFVSLLLNAGYLVLVARSGSMSNKILGAVTAYFDASKGHLEILTLCVSPEQSRKGIATVLLGELAKSVTTRFTGTRKCQPTKIWATLRVQTTNLQALAFYTNFGFIVDGVEAAYYKGARSGGSAAYRMRKHLT